MAAIPTYDKFIEPLLRFLAQHPDGVAARTGQDGAASCLGLSDEQKTQLLPSGNQHIYRNRAGWAHDRLKRVGFSESPKRGYWKITQAGLDYLAAHSGPLTSKEVDRLASTNVKVRLRPADDPDDPIARDTTDPGPVPSIADATDSTTPDDLIEQAIVEIRESVSAEILELIGCADPSFFETLVLDLLHVRAGALEQSCPEGREPAWYTPATRALDSSVLQRQ